MGKSNHTQIWISTQNCNDLKFYVEASPSPPPWFVCSVIQVPDTVDNMVMVTCSYFCLFQEYDFVFDVDIQEGRPTLKLPYNLTGELNWFTQPSHGDGPIPSPPLPSPPLARNRFVPVSPISLVQHLDDPWFAAQQFLEKNELSQLFLDQVAHFIIKNTKSVTVGPQANQSSYTDPFTGASRYVPGASTSNETSEVIRGGADPFTGTFLNYSLAD